MIIHEEEKKILEDRIKEINKEKNLSLRIETIIKLKEETSGRFFDELDDIFCLANLKPRKIILD